MVSYSALILLLIAVCGCTISADTTLPQSAYLDPKERFHIEWQYTDTNITITAKVKTTGWFGIGFSPNGGMAGADIITAGFANGKPYLQDRYAERNGFPAVDESQDVELISGSQENGVTTITFTRKHNTCDSKDLLIGTDTMRVIYAISADGSDTMSYHRPANRGTRSIYLRSSISVESNTPDDAFTMDITVNNIKVPAYHTRYYCEVKRAPKLDAKHHMIKASPLIQKENLGIVHHIILYGCFDKNDRNHYFDRNQTGFDCYNGNMPQDLNRCRAPIVTWAIGGDETIYPEEAGYPLGDDNSPDYFMMEIHYDNPQLLSGKTDNSGVRLTLTKTLRQNDARIMATGGIHGIAVPPKVKDFKYTAFCTSGCTQRQLKKDVKIFGAFLHGHLAARQISARQFRNGKEIRTIDEDKHYDFNYQQYKLLEKPVDLFPGDDIMVTCHYNTEDRKAMTYGDLPSSSEMCISYLYYYPAQALSECYSMPRWVRPDYKTSQFAKEKLKYPAKLGEHFTTIFNNMASTGQWTQEKVKILEEGHFELPQYDACTNLAHDSVFGVAITEYTAPAEAKQPPPVIDHSMQCPA